MIIIRCWSYQLIPFIPRQQLLSQWRECVCIAKSIHDKGTPNHILVNKIMDYPISEFCDYCNIVLVEMIKRGYKVSESSINKLEEYIGFQVDSDKQYTNPFINWHNTRYLLQNFYNIEKNMIVVEFLMMSGKFLEKVLKKSVIKSNLNLWTRYKL